jgi:hypothetical protein
MHPLDCGVRACIQRGIRASRAMRHDSALTGIDRERLASRAHADDGLAVA